MQKRLTELFPFLLPLRKWQRKLCFYAAMRRDGARYAKEQRADRLPYLVYETSCPMINEKTGFELKYQLNKVFNLRLAARTLDGLLINPGETFSFWQAVRYADRHTPYKDGLAEINGVLRTEYGGGLCMLSNLLFWLLLHTELTLVERHGHREKAFPEPPSEAPMGVDATVAEGWLDLKLKNETEQPFQLEIDFDDERIIGRVYCAAPAKPPLIKNGSVRYVRERGDIYEYADVLRSGTLIYTNRCRIAYTLPEGTEIEEEEQK